MDRQWMEEHQDRLDEEMRERQDRLDREAHVRQDRLDDAVAERPPPTGLWHALMRRFMEKVQPGFAPPMQSKYLVSDEPWPMGLPGDGELATPMDTSWMKNTEILLPYDDVGNLQASPSSCAWVVAVAPWWGGDDPSIVVNEGKIMITAGSVTMEQPIEFCPGCGRRIMLAARTSLP